MSAVLSLAARRARLLALRSIMDADGGGSLKLYAGVPPSAPESVVTNELLATVTLATPCGAIGAVDGVGTLLITTPLTASAVATGVVGWARVSDGAGIGVMDLLAGTVAGLSPVILTDTQVYTGGEVRLVSFLLTE